MEKVVLWRMGLEDEWPPEITGRPEVIQKKNSDIRHILWQKLNKESFFK